MAFLSLSSHDVFFLIFSIQMSQPVSCNKDLFLPIESHNELSTLSTISRIDKRVFIKLESSVHVHDSESVSGVSRWLLARGGAGSGLPHRGILNI